uniref:Dickkopf-related protein 1/2/4 C-terminal subdomain 1 domain-containing protein n=1 Tax=Nothobranchius furzeri TaxID=105023 RepID=A0A8C6KVT0_NOTFU
MDRHQNSDRYADDRGLNRTRGESTPMSGCVRSGDCAAGLCCVRYLTGKRCQSIPVEGEACLLRGPTKLRRNLGRCDCAAGLSCAAVGRAEPGKSKRQGVCQKFIYNHLAIQVLVSNLI